MGGGVQTERVGRQSCFLRVEWVALNQFLFAPNIEDLDKMDELPPEVWQCMFQHLLEGVGPQRSLLEALSCAAVCRRWRAMAHAGVGGELDLFPWRKALGDAQVAQVAGRFVHLAALSVSRCPGVTDASLHAVASR